MFDWLRRYQEAGRARYEARVRRASERWRAVVSFDSLPQLVREFEGHVGFDADYDIDAEFRARRYAAQVTTDGAWVGNMRVPAARIVCVTVSEIPPAVDAVDPTASSTGKLSTRD